MNAQKGITYYDFQLTPVNYTPSGTASGPHFPFREPPVFLTFAPVFDDDEQSNAKRMPRVRR